MCIVSRVRSSDPRPPLRGAEDEEEEEDSEREMIDSSDEEQEDMEDYCRG